MSVHDQIENLVTAAALLGAGLALVLLGLVMVAFTVNRRK